MKPHQFPPMSALALPQRSRFIAVRAPPFELLRVSLATCRNSDDKIPRLVRQARVSAERLADLSSIAFAAVIVIGMLTTSDGYRDDSLVLAYAPARRFRYGRAVRRRRRAFV